MCGIAGIVDFAGGAWIAESEIRTMLATLSHRGPDEYGIYLDRHAALGSARLSIIDLASGQQPISNTAGTLWIVYNGEIFNYVELKLELEQRGHRFSTESDTEVLLHMFEEFGPDCLDRLNGQFAFAIWNQLEQTLFLARDRLGVRPLFYTTFGKRFVFGSEIKALLAQRGISAEIDLGVLDQVFTFWAPLSSRTAFRNIFEIPPGHYLTVREGEVTSKRYWEVTFPEEGDFTKARTMDAEQYVDRLSALLIDAIRVRLRADVPVGAYLSGGLDSSLLASLVRSSTRNRLSTFSIAFADSSFDESSYQGRMAKFLGTEHQVATVTHADIGAVFPEVVWHAEAPLMRTAPAPMFILSKLVRDNGFKVVLTGEGADEFLGGYDIFKEAKIRRFWARNPDSEWRFALLRRIYADVTGVAEGNLSLLKAFFRDRLTEVGDPLYSHSIRWRNNQRNRRFFSDQVLQACTLPISEMLTLPARFAGWDPLARAQYLEIAIFLSQYLLSSQGDRMAMAHSVEGRFPFLDPRVVEFCSELPPNLKLRCLVEKCILKKLGRRWLPQEIWGRRKRPYRAPIYRSFFHPQNLEYVHELLSKRSLENSGFFKPAVVAQLVHKVKAGKPLGETDDMALAGIISTQLLHHQFIANYNPPRTVLASESIKVCYGPGRGKRDVEHEFYAKYTSN